MRRHTGSAFGQPKKKAEESYVELEVRLRDLFTKWKKLGESTKEGLADLLILEQLLNSLPPELQVWIRERKPKTTKEAGVMADDYKLARSAAEKRQCHKCQQPGRLAKDCPKKGLELAQISASCDPG